MDDVGPINNIERFTHVVVGDQHADPTVLEVGDQFADVADSDRINPRERLVQQHEMGIGCEGTGDFNPATFPARQRHRRGAAQVGDRKFSQGARPKSLHDARGWARRLQARRGYCFRPTSRERSKPLGAGSRYPNARGDTSADPSGRCRPSNDGARHRAGPDPVIM